MLPRQYAFVWSKHKARRRDQGIGGLILPLAGRQGIRQTNDIQSLIELLDKPTSRYIMRAHICSTSYAWRILSTSCWRAEGSMRIGPRPTGGMTMPKHRIFATTFA